MRNRLLLPLLVLVGVLAFPVGAAAQITVPHTFVPGGVITAAQMNANFDELESKALNRTGGTVTGTLTTQTLLPDADNSRNIGSLAASYKDAWIEGTATVGTVSAGTVSLTTLTCTGCVGATQLAATTVSGGSYGSGSSIPTFTVDADGRLTAAGSAPVEMTYLLPDAGADHTLGLVAGSDLSVDRTLTFTTGDAARTLTLSGNPTLDDWFNQSVKTTATPTFNGFTTSGTRSNVQIHSTFGGTVTDSGSATNMYGAWFGYTLSPEANDVAAGVVLAGNTINEAASGTHGILAGMYLTPPTINAAAAAVLNAATLYIGSAPSATVTGGNYALYVGAGATSLGGTLDVTGAVTLASTLTATGVPQFVNGLKERNRSIVVGETQTRTFSAGNFTTNSGTWTVDSGDVLVDTYRIVGDTLYWNLSIATSTAPGTNTEFRVAVPGGATVAERVDVPANTGYAGSGIGLAPNAVAQAQSGVGYVRVRLYDAATFGAGTNTFGVSFQIAFKVSGV